jgi:hypothetical protein
LEPPVYQISPPFLSGSNPFLHSLLSGSLITTAISESIVTAGTSPDIPEISGTGSSEPLILFASHPGVSRTSTIPSPQLTSLESNGTATAIKFISPQQFKGYPKAESRKNNKKGRAKGKTVMATNTPGKDDIEKRAAERSEKKETSGIKCQGRSSSKT